MFTNMFLAYNCLMHWPAVPVTFFMIIKEVEMTIFQLVTTNGPADYQLSWKNSKKNLDEGLWFLNPLTVITRIEGLFTKLVPRKD